MALDLPIAGEKPWDVKLNAALMDLDERADEGVARGMPNAGATGEVLMKLSDDDYDVDWAPGGGSGTGTVVADYTKTTGSLANAATETGTFTLGASEVHTALVLAADRACRVRFYATSGQLTADASRAKLVYPSGDHGLLLEVIFTAGDLSFTIDRPALLFAQSGYGAVPVSITNESGSTSTVTLTLTAKGL